MSKKDIQASFYLKTPFQDEALQLVGWRGNHWDDILYFPKKYQIGWLREGSGLFRMPGLDVPIYAGQFFLVHPGKIHSGKPDGPAGWAADSLVFQTSLVSRLFPERQPLFATIVADNPKLHAPFQELHQALDRQDGTQAAPPEVDDLIRRLFLAAASFFDGWPTAHADSGVEKAIQFVQIHYKRSFTLDELAAHSCVSKYHLLRTFKKHTGITPFLFQTQLRLNAARTLIFQHRSLTEIAYELGFADQAHFTNTFKRYAGGANPSDLLKTAIAFNFKE